MEIRGSQENIGSSYRYLINNYSQEQLWLVVLGYIPEENTNCYSIFRTDKHPDCSFTRKGDQLLFKDNAKYAGQLFFTVFQAASIIWHMSFPNVIRKMESEIKANKIPYIRKNVKKVSNKFECQIKFRYYSSFLDNPYSNLDIKTDTLNKEKGLYHVSNYWVNSKKRTTLTKNLIYNPKKVCTIAYLFPSKKVKLHFPGYKFKVYSNAGNGDFYGQYNFENYNPELPLLLTKGLKEYLIFSQEDIQVFGTMNEGINIPNEFKEFFDTFPYKYSITDNDRAGREASKKYEEENNFKPIYLQRDGDDLGTPEVYRRYKENGFFNYLIETINEKIT